MDNKEESQKQQISVLLPPGHCELVEIDMASERPRHVDIFTISGAICGGEDAEPEGGVKFPEMWNTECNSNYVHNKYGE